MATRRRRVPSSHPVNRQLIDEAPIGVRIADHVTAFMGSWRFIVIQTVIFHFDPFPFVLLNLACSTQAAYAAPLILLAGNRSAARDRMTLEHTAAEADKEEQQNLDILAGISRLEEANHELLLRIIAMEGTIIANQDGVTDKESKSGPASVIRMRLMARQSLPRRDVQARPMNAGFAPS